MLWPTQEKVEKIVLRTLEDQAPQKYQQLKVNGQLNLFVRRRAQEMLESLEVEVDRVRDQLWRREEKEPNLDVGPLLGQKELELWGQILASHLEFTDAEPERTTGPLQRV